ncbi:MAG: DNA repair protein RecN [Alphaproteobacteria bacterium]|nr:DNA repair protein RecN [Alphaproteobacteria bacterium]
MLTHLSIADIVLIEKAELAFESGLCVLSGETGAGKSILLDALGLVLGGRADSALIRRGQSQGHVAAEFDISGHLALADMLAELEIEVSDTLLIRRSLTADGKSRAIVNDAPVTVAALKRIGEMLVEIHGQHDQRTLQDTILHRSLLDEYGKLLPTRKKVAGHYHAWKTALDALSALLAEIEKAERERDYLQHMHKELAALSPQAGEEENLTDARIKMMSSEKLFEVLNEAIGILNGKDALGALRSAQKTLVRSPLTSGYSAVIEGLEKAAIEAEEALYALEKIGEESTFNPEKLEQVEERLFALKAAGRKYNVPVEELAGLRAQVEGKLDLLGQQNRESSKLERQVKEAEAAFVSVATELSVARKKAAAKLEKAIASELAPLKMEGTHFRVSIEQQPAQNWSEAGIDAVAFECATNVSKGAKDIAYASLAKIASGGELSRFMLALKVALSSVRSTPTIIFDEIDTGTGGAVADAIGKRLAVLGESAQVLVVTHLPQVAARGQQHLLVAKQTKAGKVITSVENLSRKAREEELARMLAGAKITDEARKAAKKLMEEAA